MTATLSSPAHARGKAGLKAVDRFVGIPLICLLGLRPKRTLPLAIRRIGLMKTAAIGDTLLLAGLVEDVRRTFPDATLVLVTGADNSGAGRLLSSDIDEFALVTPSFPIRAARSLRALDLDVLVDFGSWPRFDAVMSAVAGARFTVGFATRGQFRHYAYDRIVEHSGTVHERQNYARLLSAIGVEAKTPPTIQRRKSGAVAELPSSPYVVFHPWSSGYRHEVKEWSVDRWIELGRSFNALGRAIVVTGSTRERERGASLSSALAEAGVGVHDASGKFDLTGLVDLLVGADCVVSVNTGVAHLAGLAGAATISLEGPTPPLRWQPLGPRVRTVVTALPNCGYLNLGFEYAGQRDDCMSGIRADAVMDAYRDLARERDTDSNSRPPRQEPPPFVRQSHPT